VSFLCVEAGQKIEKSEKLWEAPTKPRQHIIYSIGIASRMSALRFRCEESVIEGVKEHFPRYGLAVLCCVLLSGSLTAQPILSTKRGSARDASGAVVADAQIAVTNLETNIQRVLATNERGDFEVSDLQAGRYRLTAAQAGFKTYVVDNIILEAAQIRRLDVLLEVGAVTSEVTVQGSAGVIATETAQIQGSFTYQRFDDGPWVADGRGPRVFLTTLPQVVSVNGALYNFRD